LVDGSGDPAFDADIGIRDGRIVDIGRLTGRRGARSRPRRAGHPGFVDAIPTTTARRCGTARSTPRPVTASPRQVMGNCGVGFAPAAAGDQDRLINLMSGVEDIPGTVLSEGWPGTG